MSLLRRNEHGLAVFALIIAVTFLAACAHSRAGYKTKNKSSLSELCPESDRPLRETGESSRCGQDLLRMTGQAACDADNATGCLLAANYTLTLRGENALQDPDQFDADTQEALNYAKRGCALGNHTACLSESIIGLSVASSQREKVMELQRMDQRCQAGMGIICTVLGYVAAESTGGEERAAEYQRKACDYGQVESCHQYAMYVEDGFGVEPSVSKARKLFQASCEKGSVASCEKIGAAKPVAAEPSPLDEVNVTSAEYLGAASTACDNGFRHACVQAGLFVDRGDVSIDGDGGEISVSLYERGCKLGEGWSCLLLAQKQSSGTGTDADTPLAAQNAEKACKAGVELGCDFALELTAQSLTLAETEAREAQCKGGDADACFVAGFARQHGVNFEKSEEKSLESFERGCELGSKNACYAGGFTYQQAEEPDYARANALFSKGCALEDADSCSLYGTNLILGNGVEEAEPERALDLIRKACTGGADEACGVLASYYMEGKYLERNPEKAEELYRTACNGNSASACYRLGLMIENSGDKGFQRAVVLYEYACSRENASACNRIGILWTEASEDGHMKKARDYFEKTCMLNEAQGCINLANQQLSGEGVEKDVEKALKLLEQNCAEDQRACLRLGDIYRDGEEVERSATKAAEYYKGACDEEWGVGCERLGSLKLYDAGVEYDGKAGVELYEKACEMGLNSACQTAHLLLLKGLHGDPDSKRAFKAIETGCKNGDLGACDEAADHLFAGIGVGIDAPRARSLADQNYESALEKCDRGVESSCRFVAHLIGHRHGTDTNWEEARSFLDKGCDSGQDWACAERGEQLATGEIYDIDREAAYKVLRRLCTERENNGACWDLGYYSRLGDDSGIRLDESFATFERLCEDGNTAACTRAGHQKVWGLGTDVDVKGGIELMAKACTEENNYGCPPYVATVAEYGHAKDAAKLFERAVDRCSQGYATGCQNLVLLYSSGLGTEPNATEARRVQARYCLLQGTGDVCSTSASLNSRPQMFVEGAKFACAEDGSGCVEAGLAAEFGLTAFDSGGGSRAAAKHYEAACSAGNAEGCRLRFALENRWKAPLVGTALYTYAEKGCTEETPHFCESAGYALGHAWERSLPLFEKACAAGRDNSCIWLISNGEAVPGR